MTATDAQPDGQASARRRNPRGQGARLREEILAAAVALVGRLGSIEALSLRAVAREAGITPMSIYTHFDSKEALVWELLDVEFDALAQELAAAENQAQDPVARLRARCLQYVRFGLQQPGHFLVLFGTAGRPTPPQVTPQQLPGWPAFAGFINAIESCIAAGSAPQLDPPAAALRLWIALHGMTVLRVSKKGFPWPPTEHLVDELLQDLIHNSSLARPNR